LLFPFLLASLLRLKRCNHQLHAAQPFLVEKKIELDASFDAIGIVQSRAHHFGIGGVFP